MKFTTEIIIEKPRQEVVSKMENKDNMKHWQEGLVSIEHLSGTPGIFGSKMKLNYDFGNRKMELTETITKYNFPDEFYATYTTKGIRNIQQNFFYKVAENQTKWICKNEFEPTNLMMNAMLFFMPRAFKKQTETYMKNFKKFAEKGISVSYA